MHPSLQEKLNRRKSRFRRSLLTWFRRNARDLPWRRCPDPYRVWLSEVMLQQTRVDTVLPYYEKFTAAFPAVEDLAAVDEESLLKLWEGLGYYTRARNLRKAATIIVRERNGRFPDNAEDWRRLPGIGRYTANAIASIAYGERVPVVDGNVKRVLARWLHLDSCIDDPETDRLLWSAAEDLVPRESPGDFNQAIMELGSLVCSPRKPDCPKCPLEKTCDARALGHEALLPLRRKPKPLPHVTIVAAAIRKNGRYLLAKRPPSGLLGGLWEFPGDKVDSKGSPHPILARELKQRLGIEVTVGPLLGNVDHAYSHFKVTLNLYDCRWLNGDPKPAFHSQVKWIFRKHFSLYPMPAVIRKALRLL